MASKVGSMKVGCVCLATDQGLGYLAKSFYDHGIVHKVVIQPHSRRPSHPEWYRKEDIISNYDLNYMDAVIFFETPFNWNLIPQLKLWKVKTIFMPMYECTGELKYQPDLIWNPSDLDQQRYPSGTRVTVPASVPWKLRETAKVFVHNAGNGGLGGRNGTKEVIEAMQYVKSPVRLILRSQEPVYGADHPKIDLRIGQVSEEELWSEGDAFLFPERFNGLSLPLQEAYASGMLVMAGDRFPMNQWLPREPLIPVDHYTTEKIACQFECAHYDPKVIAHTIDLWYGKDITDFSIRGKVWAELNSWEKLKPVYEEQIAAILR